MSEILWTPNPPPNLAEALCVQVSIGAGDDFFDGMCVVNQAAVDWTIGRLDTGTYLEIVDEILEVDPVVFVNETLELYLPGVELL